MPPKAGTTSRTRKAKPKQEPDPTSSPPPSSDPAPGSSPTKPKPRGKSSAAYNDDHEPDESQLKNASTSKMPLPAWLKCFTERGVDMRLAMMLAGKLYATNSSQADMLKLTGRKLEAAGLEDKDQKRIVMNALRGMRIALGVVNGSLPADAKGKKRKRDYKDDLSNPLLPGDPDAKKGREKGRDFDFKESHDIEIIRMQTVETNRAPCMTAWAFIILEKMGFDRVESLSLASTFTSITSTQHALALGNIYDAAQTRDAELELQQLPGKRRKLGGEGEEDEISGNAQPWVGVMRRKLPVIQLANGTWRGLSKGLAVEPDKAWNYITHNFREATPYVIGALRLLARCYTIEELNEKGYGMYVRFRPEVEGWGDRATLYCANIIEMIPPEDEVDLAVYGTLPAERAEQDKAAMIRPKEEDLGEDAEEVVKQENEEDLRTMKVEEGAGSAGVDVKREDVFEGFWEAELEDDF